MVHPKQNKKITKKNVLVQMAVWAGPEWLESWLEQPISFIFPWLKYQNLLF